MRWVLFVASVACTGTPAPGHATTASGVSSARTIAVEITAHGFEPDAVNVNVGDTVTLVFKREVERTCVKRVVIELDGEHTVERDLPVGERVAMTFTFDRAGELGFSCAMAMKTGTIYVHARPH